MRTAGSDFGSWYVEESLEPSSLVAEGRRRDEM